MGQVPDDLNEIPAIEAEVDTLRDRTQQLVAELERRLRSRAAQAKHTFERVKRVTDVKRQIHEHPGITIGVSSAAAVALGIGVYVVVARMLEARKPINRLRGRVQGWRALLAEPHRALRKKEPIGKRLIAAVLIAGATTIAKGLSAILMKRVAAPRMLPPHQAEHVEIHS